MTDTATLDPVAGATANRASIPRIGHGFRFQFEPAQNAHVLLYPEGMVTLNGSAAAILERCDGKRDIGDIVADLESTFAQTDLAPDVFAFFKIAVEQRWVELQ